MKISIVVPVFNAAKYLDRTIESLVNQTLKEIELIFVNDGSTDNSLDILYKAQKIYSNLVVINKENGGVSSARNAGMKYACGEYVGFVDSDDTIDIQMYEILYAASKKYGADIVSCGHSELVNEKKKDMFVSFEGELNQIDALKSIVTNTNIGMSACTKIFKRNVIAGISFDEKHKINEDRFFVYEAIKRVNKVYVVAEPLYYYYQNEGSATHAGFSNKNFDWFYFSDLIYQDVSKNYSELEPYSYADKVKSMYYIQLQYFESGLENEQFHNTIRAEIEKSNLLRVISYVSLKQFIQLWLSKYAERFFRKIKGY